MPTPTQMLGPRARRVTLDIYGARDAMLSRGGIESIDKAVYCITAHETWGGLTHELLRHKGRA